MSNLLAGYQAGDAEAFREFYSSLRPLLGARLLSCGADQRILAPLLDEVFLRIHSARRTWSPGSPVEPWATAIAEHVFRTEGRAEGCRSALPTCATRKLAPK